MDVILAIIQAAVQLTPVVENAMPAIEALLAGKTVSTPQMAQLWAAAAALEDLAASKAAAIEAGAAPAP